MFPASTWGRVNKIPNGVALICGMVLSEVVSMYQSLQAFSTSPGLSSLLRACSNTAPASDGYNFGATSGVQVGGFGGGFGDWSPKN